MKCYKALAANAPWLKLWSMLGGDCDFPKFTGTLEYVREWRQIGTTRATDSSPYEASNGAAAAGLKAGLVNSNHSLADSGRQLMLTSYRLQAVQDLQHGNLQGQPIHRGLRGRNVGPGGLLLTITPSLTPWVVLTPHFYFYGRKLNLAGRSRPRREWPALEQRQPEYRFLGAFFPF